MLRTDVVMTKRERLAKCQLENLLGARCKRNLTRRDLFALADDARNIRADVLDRNVEGVEHARGETLLLTQQAEQDVLGADVVVLECTGLVLCKDDNLACTLCKSFKHCWPPTCYFAGSRCADSTTSPVGCSHYQRVIHTRSVE